jgi:hypothetical protein
MKISTIFCLFPSLAALAFPVAAQDALLIRAARIIKEHHLLTPKAQKCSKLILRDSENDRVGKVGVYEVHDETCGGDPFVEHRLFDLEVDMKTGAAKWDSNPKIEMRPVPPAKIKQVPRYRKLCSSDSRSSIC